MKYLLLFLIVFMQSNMILFDFNSKSKINQWRIVDDVVMGGQSDGTFKINKEGHGEFSGDISLENNGGFSSLRYSFEKVNSSKYSIFQIQIKGDGKAYQFRVKSNENQRYSYVYEFKTSGDWETISIPFNKMKAQFRGQKLQLPNFDGQQMKEIAFLIGNKKEQSFKLEIDTIALK